MRRLCLMKNNCRVWLRARNLFKNLTVSMKQLTISNIIIKFEIYETRFSTRKILTETWLLTVFAIHTITIHILVEISTLQPKHSSIKSYHLRDEKEHFSQTSCFLSSVKFLFHFRVLVCCSRAVWKLSFIGALEQIAK